MLSGFATIAPPVGTVLYGAVGGSNTTSDLYTIDPDDGTPTSVGPIGFGMTGLSFRPSDNVLFGVTNNNSASNPGSLITVDPVTGAGTLVGSLGFAAGVTLADIAFRDDDVLYGYSAFTSRLYTVNTTTGTATQVSATQVPPPEFGYALGFNPSDVLYVFPKGDSDIFYTVDPATAALTAQPTLTGSPLAPLGQINAGKFNGATFWASIIVGATAWVATIDVTTGVITGVGTTVSRLDALAWDFS